MIPPPFSHRGLRRLPCLRSVRHNVTSSTHTRLTPIIVPSLHLYRLLKRSPASRQPDSPNCCSSPTLMYSLGSITPVNAPSSSRVASSLATQAQADSEVPYHPLSSQASHSTSSLHLSEPFRYPKPNYNKSYKHLNRLKYHVPYGPCNFASPEDLEAPRVLLAEKGTINGNVNSGAQVTEEELHEIERRLRPYACGIDDCQRRYVGMKDLRTSLPHPGSHPHLLILSVCRTSLSALR